MWLSTSKTARKCLVQTKASHNVNTRSAVVCFGTSNCWSSTFTGSHEGWNKPFRPNTFDQSQARGKLGSARVSGVSQQGLYRNPSNDPPRSKNELLLLYTRKFKDLRQQVLALPPLPALWADQHAGSSSSDPPQDAATRHQILQDTLKLVENFKADVKHGFIEPSGRHRSETSIFLQCALENLAASYQRDKDKNEIYNYCVEIMKLMKQWKLNLLHSHCDNIILAAAREGLWKEASELFSSRINPGSQEGAGGFNCPLVISVQNPIGLYCIARHAQQHGGSAAESVMNGVLHMSMVSPGDQARYVLAAGTALGYAGECESLVQYVHSSLNAKQLGQHLNAAAMHACLLCHRPEAAVQIFDQMTSGDHHARVGWQWGGGEEKLLPVCRDLVIRALGFSEQTNTTDEVFQYFQQIQDEDMTISFEAVLGMLLSCEKDGEWKKAMGLLFYVLEKNKDNLGWLREGSALDIPEAAAASTSDEAPVPKFTAADMITVLEFAMSACNTSGQFGAALFCAQRFAHIYAPDVFPQHDDGKSESGIADLLRSIAALSSHPGNFVSISLVTLYGSKCFVSAKDLCKMTKIMSNAAVVSPELYSFGSSEMVPSGDLSMLWNRIVIGTRKVLEFHRRFKNEEWSTDDRRLVSFACSRILNQFSCVGSPAAGIIFLSWVVNTCFTSTSFPEPIELVDSIQSGSGSTTIELSDSLLAALMGAMIQQGGSSASLQLYERVNESKSWILSTNEAVKALFKADRKAEALALFENSHAKVKCPDTFRAVASNLLDHGDFDGVLNTFKRALSSGCISESLCLLVMGSISRSPALRKKPMLTDIADDARRLTGSSTIQGWVEKHYWDLRRRIGHGHVSLLLDWRDRSTLGFDELELALSVIKERSSSGLVPHDRSLKAVARALWSYHDGFVPNDKTRIPNVPRTKENWRALALQLLKVSEQSHLYRDGWFMSGLAMGLLKLECFEEFTELVMNCLSRGVVLDSVVLEAASRFSSQEALVDAAMAFNPFYPITEFKT